MLYLKCDLFMRKLNFQEEGKTCSLVGLWRYLWQVSTYTVPIVDASCRKGRRLISSCSREPSPEWKAGKPEGVGGCGGCSLCSLPTLSTAVGWGASEPWERQDEGPEPQQFRSILLYLPFSNFEINKISCSLYQWLASRRFALVPVGKGVLFYV